MNCKNCGEVSLSNYCGTCGQATKVDKITLSTLARDFTEDILQVNKGFLYTFTNLFTRPGHSIRDYLEGQRKRHYRSITYLLLLSTAYFLITKWTGQNTWINDAMVGFSNGAMDTHGASEMPHLVTLFADNYAYTTLLLLPVFSLASYLSFPKSNANYLEHIVLNAYITGQQAVIYATFALIMTVVDNDVIEMFPLLVAMLYCFWAFNQFFSTGRTGFNILRSIATYILYLVFASILLTLIVALDERFNR